MPGAKEVPETEFPQEPAMNKTCLALAAVAALVATPLASAQNAAGDLVMRARVVHLDPANKDSIPGLDVGIKWPNDVVINGKKICGILTEMYQSAAGSFFLVIGTGINVNQKEFPEEVKKTADSLALELGTDVDREVLLASVLRHFWDCYDSFLETMDLSGQKELYESFLVNKGRVVEVLDPKGEWQGTAIGIEKTGELLVRRKDGSVEAVYAGEVSVRGIYGYV